MKVPHPAITDAERVVLEALAYWHFHDHSRVTMTQVLMYPRAAIFTQPEIDFAVEKLADQQCIVAREDGMAIAHRGVILLSHALCSLAAVDVDPLNVRRPAIEQAARHD